VNRPGIADHAASKESLMKRYRKAIVAVLGLAATLVSAGVLDHTAEAIVDGILAAATALGVYAVPNEPAPPTV
jgi:hypothetical protein